MAEFHNHNEEEAMRTRDSTPVVETNDQRGGGLFDLSKKKEDEEVIPSEFEEKVMVSEIDPENRHELHRSHSSSTSSSDEAEECGDEKGEEEKKKKEKEKKSIKDKIKEKLPGDHHQEEGKVVEDTEVPVEKIHAEEEEVTDHESTNQEKRGFLDKIKDKLPAQMKEAQPAADVATPPPTTNPAVEEECTGGAAAHEGEGKEKKGFLDKIKEKIPGRG